MHIIAIRNRLVSGDDWKRPDINIFSGLLDFAGPELVVKERKFKAPGRCGVKTKELEARARGLSLIKNKRG